MYIYNDPLTLTLMRASEQLKGFDFIVSWMAICHIDDKEHLLEKCYQLLRPGGKL